MGLFQAGLQRRPGARSISKIRCTPHAERRVAGPSVAPRGWGIMCDSSDKASTVIDHTQSVESSLELGWKFKVELEISNVALSVKHR